MKTLKLDRWRISAALDVSQGSRDQMMMRLDELGGDYSTLKAKHIFFLDPNT